MSDHKNKKSLFKKSVTLLQGNDGKIEVTQELYNRDGSLYLEVTHKGSNIKQIPVRIKAQESGEALIECLENNWEQMKTELQSIKNTIGGYIYSKTGEKSANVAVGPYFAQYRMLVDDVLEEYFQDWELEAKRAIAEGGSLKSWGEVYPIADRSRVLRHIRGAIYESTPGQYSLRLDGLEKEIMQCEDAAELCLRKLADCLETISEHGEREQHNKITRLYNNLSIKIGESIRAFDDAWDDTLKDMRSSGVSDMEKVRERCDPLDNIIGQTKDAYSEFHTVSGLRLTNKGQVRADEMDDLELVFEQMEKLAGHF